MPTENLRNRLETLHARWHHSQFLGTDPLVLVRDSAPDDREVVAFLVSCLALGRASQIVGVGRTLLQRIGSPVRERLLGAEPGSWTSRLEGFVYRFFSADRVSALLDALGTVLRDHGTLEQAWRSTGKTGWDALGAFADLFRSSADLGILIPSTGSGGASKRLCLFLRWMVRSDGIDLGLWSVLQPSDLFMPVDTHVLQWARAEGLSNRKTADRLACWEITSALRTLVPEDPLRFDFAITREGMWKKGTLMGKD